MQRCQVFEGDLVFGIFRFFKVDLADLEQREVTFTVLWRPYLAIHGIAGTQAEAANLAGGDVDVIRPGEVGTVRRAQETKPVLQNF